MTYRLDLEDDEDS